MSYPPTIPPVRTNGQLVDASHVNDLRTAVSDIVTKVTATDATVAAQGAALPRIRGTVSSEEALPGTGTAGDLYLVGGEGDLYAWDTSTTAWISVGNIAGPPGNPGPSGTILGILGPGENPPVGTAAGTLWFQATSALPSPAVTPQLVGSSAKTVGSIASTTITPPAGIQNGDIGVMVVVTNTTTAVTPTPAGWTLAGTVVDSNMTTWLWTRSLLAADGAYTIDDTRATRKAISMVVLRNVALESSGLPHQSVAFNVSSANNTQALPTVVTSKTSALLSFWVERQGTGPGYTADGSAFTVPSGFTKAGIAISAGTGSGECSAIAGYDLTERTAGTIPSGSPTWIREAVGSATANNVLWTVALEAL